MGTMERLNCFIHVGTFATFFFTNYYAFVHLRIPMLQKLFEKFDVGQLKYLTIWCLIVQALFFFICVLNDFFGSNAVNPKKRPLMRRIKDFFHATFSFPLAMFVGITFWSLMFVDRELVLPKAMDPYFPWWLNHLMHTMIMVSTVLELFIAPRQYPTRFQALSSLLVFMVIYLVWIHVIYAKTGVWVYPALHVLSLPLRVAFLGSLFLFVVMMYLAGEALNNLVWGSSAGGSGKKKKSK